MGISLISRATEIVDILHSVSNYYFGSIKESSQTITVPFNFDFCIVWASTIAYNAATSTSTYVNPFVIEIVIGANCTFQYNRPTLTSSESFGMIILTSNTVRMTSGTGCTFLAIQI